MLPKLEGALCSGCPGLTGQLFHSEATQLAKPRLIVLTDGPTATDVEEKKLLSGGGGRLFEQRLKREGISKSDCQIIPAVACYVSRGEKEKHFKAAVKCCAGRARAELQQLPADVPLVTLGPYALQVAMGWSGKKSIIAARKNPGFRGSVIAPGDPVRKPNAAPQLTLPLLFPNDVVKADKWAPIFANDMARVGRVERNGWVAPEHLPGKKTITIQSLAELQQLEQLLPDERASFDIETNGLDLFTIDMVCFVLSDQSTAVVVPWTKTQCGEGPFFNGSQPIAAEIINAFLAKKIAVTHNGALFDNPVARRHGIKPMRWEDTLIAYHTLTSHFPKALSHVVSCYVDAPPWKHWDHGESLQTLWDYCGRDGLYTALAEEKLFSQFDENDWNVYQCGKNAAVLASEMTFNGFAFDTYRAKEISAALLAAEESLRDEAVAITGIRELNLRSPKQLQKLFFGKLGARVITRSKDGSPTLDVGVLQAYAASSNPELARMSRLVLEARGVRKCRSTYVDKIEIRNGRVHPSWRSYGTETGRWSGSGPSLPTLPKPQKDPAFKAGFGGIRSLYIAPPGRKLVAYDVKQAEFRVAAYYSRDPNMIKAAAELDIHSANATTLFGKAFTSLPADAPQRKKYRDLAKTSTFAVCYLAEAPTVHAKLVSEGESLSLREVEFLINSLRKNYAQYYAFCAENVGLTMRRGYVESPILKRKRYLGYSPEPPKVANYPIQSGTADIYNLKMWDIRNRLLDAKVDALAVASVYDAGYYDVAEKDVDRVAQIITEVWEEPVRLGEHDVVLPIDLHVAERWSDL